MLGIVDDGTLSYRNFLGFIQRGKHGVQSLTTQQNLFGMGVEQVKKFALLGHESGKHREFSLGWQRRAFYHRETRLKHK